MSNQFIQAMQFRHACKAFDDTKKISDSDFNDILEIGRLSPSSFGFEPWKFVVVQNPALREKLKAFSWGAQGQLPTASHFVIILARKAKGIKYDSDYINYMFKEIKQLPEDVEKLYRGFYENFQKKDFKLLESERNLFDWACRQAYIALANMMSGAASMGIDSCPIEGFDAESMESFLKNELGIDTQEFGTAVMVAFGYRKDEPKRAKIRQNLDAISSWYN